MGKVNDKENVKYFFLVNRIDPSHTRPFDPPHTARTIAGHPPLPGAGLACVGSVGKGG